MGPHTANKDAAYRVAALLLNMVINDKTSPLAISMLENAERVCEGISMKHGFADGPDPRRAVALLGAVAQELLEKAEALS